MALLHSDTEALKFILFFLSIMLSRYYCGKANKLSRAQLWTSYTYYMNHSDLSRSIPCMLAG